MEKEQFEALVAKVTEAVGENVKGISAEEVAKQIAEKNLPNTFVDQASVEQVKVLAEEAAQKANNALDNISKAGNFSGPVSFKQAVNQALEANKERLAAFKQNRSGEIEIEIKAPAEQTTGNVTLPVATPAAYTYQDASSVVPLPEPIPFVQQYTDNGNTDSPAIAWVEEVGREGDVAFIGEGVMKPLMDLDYEIRYSQPKKAAGKVKVTEEALDDIPFLSAEINGKLRQRHDLAIQNGILNGDGTGANLLGLTQFAAAFAAGGLATSIDNAQNYDAISAAYNQIIVTSDQNYAPNAVFVHPSDAMLMRLSKDANNNYLMPPFAGANGDTVMGLTVVPNVAIPVGSFLIGDFRRAHVRTYKGFTIRIGYGINAAGTESDFERNLLTILGESRLHFYVSENEKIAFVYDTFANVKTAIETP